MRSYSTSEMECSANLVKRLCLHIIEKKNLIHVKFEEAETLNGVQEIPAEDREPEREAERFPLRNATMIRDPGKNHEAVTVMISAGKTSM